MAFINHAIISDARRKSSFFRPLQRNPALVRTLTNVTVRHRRAHLIMDASDSDPVPKPVQSQSTAGGNGVSTESAPPKYASEPSEYEDDSRDACSIEDIQNVAIASDMFRHSADKDSIVTDSPDGRPSDLFRVGAVGILVAIVGALLQHNWIQDHRDIAMIGIFVAGYVGIVLENTLAFDKTGVALLMGVGVWTVLMTDAGGGEAAEHVKMMLEGKMADISQILFFLIGAMTIVEIVDAHKGFKVVTDFITTNNRKTLLWVIGILTFFTSAVLDNLTSTIVIVSLLRKLVSDPKERWLYGAVVVVAANAGGAWTPIGDVTTTQLWVHGNITAFKTMVDLFIPSMVSLLVSLSIFTPMIGDGDFKRPGGGGGDLAPRAPLVFWTGLAALVSVPIFKTVTGLPPYLGMLSGLGTLWVMTDVLHAGEDRDSLRGLSAVKRIDTSGVLFFLGILLAVAGLESAGILTTIAHFLDAHVHNREIIATSIGLLSAIVDNVPLVAATMGMYSLDQVPQDSDLWQLIAYCAGTGGSLLIIGSAAGVAFMYVPMKLFTTGFETIERLTDILKSTPTSITNLFSLYLLSFFFIGNTGVWKKWVLDGMLKRLVYQHWPGSWPGLGRIWRFTQFTFQV